MPYQRGDRVSLVRTADPYTALVEGHKGTVKRFDATLHEGNVPARAAREALETLERRDRLHSQAVFLAAIQKAEALVRDIAA